MSRLRRVSAAPLGKRLATVTQHREVAALANELGIPKPFFFWAHDAEREIKRLKQMVRQPVLAGFAASTGGSNAA